MDVEGATRNLYGIFTFVFLLRSGSCDCSRIRVESCVGLRLICLACSQAQPLKGLNRVSELQTRSMLKLHLLNLDEKRVSVREALRNSAS